MCQHTIYDHSLCSSHGLLSLSIHMIDLINLDEKSNKILFDINDRLILLLIILIILMVLLYDRYMQYSKKIFRQRVLKLLKGKLEKKNIYFLFEKDEEIIFL